MRHYVAVPRVFPKYVHHLMQLNYVLPNLLHTRLIRAQGQQSNRQIKSAFK